MPGVELSDRHSDCSAETILSRYHLDDRVLWRIAAIVHEAVDDDERHDAPEACGLDPALRGLSMIDTDTRTGPPFAGLAEFYRRATLLNRDPPDGPYPTPRPSAVPLESKDPHTAQDCRHGTYLGRTRRRLLHVDARGPPSD